MILGSFDGHLKVNFINMKKFNNWIGYALICILSITLFSCQNDDDDDKEPVEEILIIKDKAKFNIGAAIKTKYLDEPAYVSALTQNFSQITAEYEMKMDNIWSSDGTYNWTQSDELVDFAKTNSMDVHGHVLVWYNAFPDWFNTAAYDSATFENKVKDYINTVVTRYKDDVISWDVTNEIFNDDGSLRSDNYVYAKYKDPIAFYGRCYQYARNADADAKLFYNDYSVALVSAKRYAIKQMVQRFQNEGYPIDGIGDQFHYMLTTNETSLETGIKDMASTGLLIHISELDIRVNTDKSNSYLFNTSQKEAQSDKYEAIVKMFESIPQNQKFAITTWGVTDKYTWLTSYWNTLEYPLLFDSNYNQKEAYTGFLNGLN